MQEEKKMDNVEEQKVESTETATQTTSQEDIFSEIFGQKEEQFVATTEPEPEINPESNPSDVQDTSDPKSESDSYRYWQSEADKRSAEVELLKSQVSDLMKGQQSPEAKPAEKETVKLEKPVKPRKPADYDHSEALADSESESGKFLAKQEQYLDEITSYMTSVEEQREEQSRVQHILIETSEIRSPKQAKDLIYELFERSKEEDLGILGETSLKAPKNDRMAVHVFGGSLFWTRVVSVPFGGFNSICLCFAHME